MDRLPFQNERRTGATLHPHMERCEDLETTAQVSRFFFLFENATDDWHEYPRRS